MSKLVLTDITSGYASTTATNANNTLIETALENTLSRDGESPNQMLSDLDMNGHRILNSLAQSGEGFIWKGAWITSLVYALNNLVSNASSSYICTVTHTAGANFATDLAAGKWQLLAQQGLPGAGTGDMLVANNLSELTATKTTARGNISAASSGVNNDITQLTGITTPLSVAQGGTGLNAPGTVGNVLTSNGSAWVSSPFGEKIQPITCTQTSGALTLGTNATTLDFRSTTLTTGVPNTRAIPALSMTIPSGATLGAVTTVSARLISIVIDNAGTPEQAVINLSGGNNLSETGLISTTAISAGATASNVFYSTTARSNVAYRVVGAVDAVNTAGAWGNPSLVQGYGGQALAAMSSMGYGQTWQNMTSSRVLGTTYYNSSDKPITVCVRLPVTATNIHTITVSGIVLVSSEYASAGVNSQNYTFIVPIGSTYIVTNTAGTIAMWAELC